MVGAAAQVFIAEYSESQFGSDSQSSFLQGSRGSGGGWLQFEFIIYSGQTVSASTGGFQSGFEEGDTAGFTGKTNSACVDGETCDLRNGCTEAWFDEHGPTGSTEAKTRQSAPWCAAEEQIARFQTSANFLLDRLNAKVKYGNKVHTLWSNLYS